ncbi:hypothetical protein Syun_031818 [Stephania yunnanensis]|uniref:Uncharacterized protein n=1 Tax=Stephania yunnanensis TaxID=152371 RepID=A0AAP0HF74_9MAGN
MSGRNDMELSFWLLISSIHEWKEVKRVLSRFAWCLGKKNELVAQRVVRSRRGVYEV